MGLFRRMKFIDIVEAYVIGMSLTLITLMIYVFMRAYQNGMKIIVTINTMGEAKTEALLIVLYLIGIIILTIARFKKW